MDLERFERAGPTSKIRALQNIGIDHGILHRLQHLHYGLVNGCIKSRNGLERFTDFDNRAA